MLAMMRTNKMTKINWQSAVLFSILQKCMYFTKISMLEHLHSTINGGYLWLFVEAGDVPLHHFLHSVVGILLHRRPDETTHRQHITPAVQATYYVHASFLSLTCIDTHT